HRRSMAGQAHGLKRSAGVVTAFPTRRGLVHGRGRVDVRRLVDILMTGVTALCVVVSLVPLVSILGYLVIRGVQSLDWAFFTRLPVPVGEPGGGMANALVGSAIVVGMASLMGIPVGVLAGIYLAEYGRRSRLGSLVRFFCDVQQGVPSIDRKSVG